MSLISTGILLPCIFTATRSGLQLDGGGFLVYMSALPTNTSSFEVSGTFSTTKSNQKQVVIAAEGKDGNFLGYFAITTKGCRSVFVNTTTTLHTETCVTSNPYQLNSGAVFNFRTTFSTKSTTENGNKTFSNEMSVSINQYGIPSQVQVKKSKETWNLQNATLYIGGYPKIIKDSSSFVGCISDVVVKGTNIISTYFSQSGSSHTNPMVTGGTLPENATVCNDLLRTTQAPPTTTLKTTPAPSNASSATSMQSAVYALVFPAYIILSMSV